ncbi:hydrogenase expression protein HypA [Methanoculleus taiwanensis]|uniref:Hydrogenase expression protein HypA n=1 Tax=Methanoculleus taiwanensis TaxID=1550565 RepID=A0A498GZ05_9EURY|nr:hydrophobe/amphiphile efflux-3 (HAE3) family transporter [Methanoculleus taiwanensis]RXE55354.1 hydrogenase expression protein HypA [Methanoculleus taiwanensis]
MKSLFHLIADLINRRPLAVAAVFMLVFVIAIYGMGQTTMQTGSDTYIDKDTTRGALLDTYTDTFKSDAVMLLVESDNILDPETLAYLDRLQAEIAGARHVTGTSSIVDLVKQVNGGVLPTSEADIIAAKERVPAEQLNRFAPSNLMTVGIVTLEPGLTMEVKTEVLNDMESRIRLSDMPPGVKVTVSGDAAFSKQMSEEMGTSMGVLIGAAMLLMVLAVALLFGHVRYRFLPVFVVAAGLIMTFGIMGLVGIPISMVVIGAFPVLIGIGIDYAIQFQSRFDEEMQSSTIPQAVVTTVANSGPAIFYAMVATSLGFIAMWISPVPMVRDFGLICVIGVISCYLAALIIVPTFGTLIKYRPKATGGVAGGATMEVYDRFLGNVAGKIAKNPIPLIVILGIVAVAGVQLDSRIPINSDEETFVPSDMPAVVDLHKVSRVMGSTESMPIFVRGYGVTELDGLTWMKEFQDYELAHNDKITSATSIVTYVLQYNNGTMPATDREAAEVLERIPEATRDQYISGNTEAIIEFGLVEMENDVALSLVERMTDDIAWMSPPPGITATPTGMLEMFTNLMNDISESKTTMTLLGFGLILLFLIFVYRKFTAISPIIPIIFIVGWNGAIMFILGIDYSPMTATLGSMTIGVASEYTILIMERYQEERARGREKVEAIRQAVQKIGTAITVSGMTTVFGFSALLLSTFNIIKNFGVVTVITVGFSLIGAILVMPAVLSLMGRFSKSAPAGAAHEEQPTG